MEYRSDKHARSTLTELNLIRYGPFYLYLTPGHHLIPDHHKTPDTYQPPDT